MSRTFRVNFGRKTVRPFEAHDINNMLVLCKKTRNQAEVDNNEEQRYLWDRNYMILVIGMNLAFRIEDILQLRVDNFIIRVVFFLTSKYNNNVIAVH